MTRYLSAARLCMIVLIDVYHQDEARTNDTVALLSFIAQHTKIDLGSASRLSYDQPPPPALSIGTFEALLSPLISKFPGRSLYDVFLRYLWSLTGLDGIEDLLVKSRGLEKDADKGRKTLAIHPSSPIGQYLRSCQVDHSRLPFHHVQRLWEDFCAFREPSRGRWAARNPEDANALPMACTGGIGMVSPILLERQRQAEQPAATSSVQSLNSIIQFQLRQVQATGCRLSPEMKAQLASSFERSAASFPDAHFLKFFDAWRAGSYSEALDCLHRYFDYTLDQQATQQSVKTYHQYALLHLAVLQADFSCYEEAISAMNECISTARENQDSRCLNFGLAWLVHLRKAHPEYANYEIKTHGSAFAGSEGDILTFLQQKAIESKDWTQLSNALLSQAESIVHNGGSLAKAFQLSIQSRHLNSKHRLEDLRGAQIRLHGALFHLTGQDAMSNMVRRVYQLLPASGGAETLALSCTTAYDSAHKGRYDMAIRILKDCDPHILRTMRLGNIHSGFVSMVQLKRALRSNDLVLAERLLKRVTPLRDFAEPDVAFETHLLEIEYLRKTHQNPEAFTKLGKLFQTLKRTKSSSIPNRIRLLIVKADLWAHAGRPAKAFSVTLRAANAAYTRNLAPLLWRAIAALSAILEDLEEFESMRALLDAILPRALEGGDPEVVAKLYGLLANAYIGLAMQEGQAQKTRDGLMNSGAVYIERAKLAYDQIQDVDGIVSCLEKKAMLYKFRGEEALAGDMLRMREADLAKVVRTEREALGLVEE